MHGNVAEWCLDHWLDSHQAAPGNSRAWLILECGDSDEYEKCWPRFSFQTHDASFARLVREDVDGSEIRGAFPLRGGCWNSPSVSCRSACLSLDAAVLAFSDVGFRVVCLPQ